MEILAEAHTKELASMLDKQMKTNATKVNMSGVEVMGSLDKRGQLMTQAYKEGMELDMKALDEKILEAQSEMGNENPEYAAEAQARM